MAYKKHLDEKKEVTAKDHMSACSIRHVIVEG